MSKLWDFTRISVTQNNSQELEIWDQWNDKVRQLFYDNYGDLLYLLDVKVDKRLFRALAQFWNPAYNKVYSRAINMPTFSKKLMSITDVRKRVDVLALSIYGLVVFPKALGHIDEAVTDLFDRLDKIVTPISVILAETFRVLYRVFSENYSPLKEIVATPRRDDISEEKWMVIL
ncbi:hypothetical protein Gotur_027618 [Gossypium turneri]